MSIAMQDTTTGSEAVASEDLRRENQELRVKVGARPHRVGREDDGDYESRARGGARQGSFAHARPCVQKCVNNMSTLCGARIFLRTSPNSGSCRLLSPPTIPLPSITGGSASLVSNLEVSA